ncbi:MAG: TolC family protein [Bacteroidota bacterium]
MKHYALIFFFLAWGLSLSAQKVLTVEEVLDWALENHPVAGMAEAVELQGPAALLRSQGAFDPKVFGAYDRKEYLGTEYFNYGDAGVEWQSPYAVKVAAGFQWASGTYLSDENFISQDVQSYIGIKLPLLQGLLTDAARIDRRRGDVAVDRQRAVAEIIRNELRYDVTVLYAEWLFAERSLIINQETEVLLETYLRDTRELFRQGDKPAVDTLEATIYLGTQRLATEQATIDARLARLALAEVYWPMRDEMSPFVFSNDLLQLPAGNNWAANHPELRDLQLTISDYQLEQRLKQEKLKPVLDVNYYLLGDGFQLPAGDDQYGGPLDRAYKIGATLSYPILNRKARGDVQLGKLKILEGEAKLADKQQALGYKAQAYADAVTAYTNQLAQADILTEQAERLLIAERDLFRLGESTQFLLNARQQALQKALLVAEKLRFSRNKAVMTYRYLVANWL